MTTTATLAARSTSTRTVAALLGGGGLLVAVGGQLHPIGEGDDLTAALASMTGDGLWTLSHLFLLAGLSLAVGGLAAAYTRRAFGPRLDGPLRLAIWGYSLAALELVPHLLVSHDHDELSAGHLTGFVRVHLALEAVAGPALAISTIVVAVAVARAAGTRPAWVLAALATLGSVAFGLAAPLVSLTDNPTVAALFIGEFGVAIWLVGTAVRLARSGSSALHGLNADG